MQRFVKDRDLEMYPQYYGTNDNGRFVLYEDAMANECKLREMLWLSHGCGFAYLYGDDGEMQCSNCMTDFKRDSILAIETKFRQRGEEQVIKAKEVLGVSTK